MANAQEPDKAPTLGATNVAIDAPMATPKAAPSWGDEFDGTTVDQSKWRFDTAFNKSGWFNHEKQYYAKDRPENARLTDGHLVIEARREALSTLPDWGGQAYSSAKLVATKPTRYGFYEIRAKLPCTRGTWPAIWMLPQSGKWPEMGEIDIMEMVGHDANVVHATLHTGLFNHAKGTQRGAQQTIPTACTEFHRYQMDWRADSITIGIDDRAHMRVRDDQPGGHGAWPFDTPFNLILNLAIGGDWGGAKGIDDAALPQRMEVDYVRVWEAK
jgi:beta-glucanase (GH16 family)